MVIFHSFLYVYQRVPQIRNGWESARRPAYFPTHASANLSSCIAFKIPRQTPNHKPSHYRSMKILFKSLIYTMWGPPVISWFINPIDYSYLSTINHSEIGVIGTNLAIERGPHIVTSMNFDPIYTIHTPGFTPLAPCPTVTTHFPPVKMWRLAAAYAVVEAAQEGDVRLAGDAETHRFCHAQFGNGLWLMYIYVCHILMVISIVVFFFWMV